MCDVIRPSDIFENSNLRKDLPDAFLQASAIWPRVKEKYLKYSEKNVSQWEMLEDLKCLEGIFTKSCWGWLPSCRIIPFDKMDRLGQHFYGPMYTCEGHEWPEYKGCPFRPWVQLDLDKASETAGVDFAGGLLQFFETPEYDCYEKYFVRHIPRADISIKAMTPVPHFTPSMAEIFEKYLECTPAALFGEKAKCIKVKAFDRKVFSIMNTDLCFESLEEIAREDIEDIIDLLYSLEREKKKSMDRMHLFGCDYPIQRPAYNSFDVLLHLGHCGRQSSVLSSYLEKNFDSYIDCYGTVYGDGSGAIYIAEVIDGVPFWFEGSR